MKKIVSLIIVLLILVSFVGCALSQSGEIKVKSNNYGEYLEFIKIEDNSIDGQLNANFLVREKGDYLLSDDFSATVELHIWYRCDDGDMDEYIKEVQFASNNREINVKYDSDRIINFSGRVIESVKYEVVKISGTVLTETSAEIST